MKVLWAELRIEAGEIASGGGEPDPRPRDLVGGVRRASAGHRGGRVVRGGPGTAKEGKLVSIDLTQVPLEDLRSEWARRNAERRKTRAGGRRKKLVRCEKCGASGGVREMRRHQCKLESGLLR